jgi:hypothetical protein
MTDDLSDEAATAFTVDQHSNLKPWKPGMSGNPSGRKTGSRNKLSAEFLDALYLDFAEHGAQVIAKVRIEKPDVYLKVVSNLMPARLEAQLEAKVDVNHSFGDCNSTADILEMVAQEAGPDAAMQLAAVFGLEYSPEQPIAALPRPNRSYSK